MIDQDGRVYTDSCTNARSGLADRLMCVLLKGRGGSGATVYPMTRAFDRRRGRPRSGSRSRSRSRHHGFAALRYPVRVIEPGPVNAPPFAPPSAAGADTPAPLSYERAIRACFSAVERRDFDAAIQAATDAAALEPGLVLAYHFRAIAWLVRGDYVQAARDRATCAALDPHYREAPALRRALDTIRAAYQRDPVVDDGWKPEACGHPALRATLERREAEMRRRRSLLARPSCDLPCPSLCCYFEEEPFSNGIVLSDDELSAVRDCLCESGQEETRHLAWVGGKAYPKRDGRTIPADLGWRPRSSSYGEILWLTSRSRACAFVDTSGCAVHDAGGAGITACRAFLCVAAFVCLLLRDEAIVDAAGLARHTMTELHELAVTVVPQLAALFDAPDVVGARQDMRAALGDAIDRDRAGNTSGVDAALGRYGAGAERQERGERRVRAALQEAVGSFLDRSTS